MAQVLEQSATSWKVTASIQHLHVSDGYVGAHTAQVVVSGCGFVYDEAKEALC